MLFRILASLPVFAQPSVDVPTRLIAADVHMPVISIGTGGQEHTEASAIASAWLWQGGRGIDTALVYGNQEIVGNAIADSGISREDIFVTTKIPTCDNAEANVQMDLQQLGMEYIDLMLIHSPRGADCGAAWAILEDYHAQGVLRAIGVSNFKRSHLETLKATMKVVPHVNQIQFNVLEHDDDQIAATLELGILVEAYSPLGRSGQSGDIPGHPTMQKIAAAHNVSTYQVAIKWILQSGHLLTFQSSSPEHQAVNADVFHFELTNSEMEELNILREPCEAWPDVLPTDEHGKYCVTCDAPSADRLDRSYTQFRHDCGNLTNATGIVLGADQIEVATLDRPASNGRPATNGFCELNTQKSCVDAMANRDYMYYAKGVDLNAFVPCVREWHKQYCLLNGFLELDVVALAHASDFEAMRARGRRECEGRIAESINISAITMASSRAASSDCLARGAAPDEALATYVAAWNCGMGDVACDMVYCSYSYCKLGNGSIGFYDECEGWDKVRGMRHGTEPADEDRGRFWNSAAFVPAVIGFLALLLAATIAYLCWRGRGRRAAATSGREPFATSMQATGDA